TFHEPRIPVVSNLTGRLVVPGELTCPGYWARHARSAVRYRDGVTALHSRGVRIYLEVGPHPVLTPATEDTLRDLDPDNQPVIINTGRRDHGGPTQVTAALAQAHAHGVPVIWPAASRGGSVGVELPPYPFDRHRYWLEIAPVRGGGERFGMASIGHPVLDGHTP